MQAVPQIIVRPARLAERTALEDLQRRASLVSEMYREQLLMHPDAIDLPAEQVEAGQVHVAERLGTTLGFCVVLPRRDGEAELDGLFVEPGQWKQGVGRLLAGHAERASAAMGARMLWVVANPDALGFYRACGFEAVGEEQTRFGMALTMRKPIAAGGGDQVREKGDDPRNR